MAQHIRVRQFGLPDLERVMDIEFVSFGTDAFSKATFRSLYHYSADLFIIAELPGYLVGYMVTCILYQKGHIVSIAVDPTYRQKGVGRTLVNNTLHRLEAASVNEVELEVRTTNTAAIHFWESLSIKPIGTIPNYYRDGTDALRMRKFLSRT